MFFITHIYLKISPYFFTLCSVVNILVSKNNNCTFALLIERFIYEFKKNNTGKRSAAGNGFL